MQANRTFIPAAGHDAALPLYDPLTWLAGAQSRRKLLIERACPSSGQRVLDVGCGTGTLAVALKRAEPRVEVTGIDPDPRALTRARSKASRAGVQVRFEQGFGDALPWDDASFERVLSSFMLHHLARPLQQKLLSEALRVLVPGGSFHLIDFARSARGRVLGRNLDGAEWVDQDLRQAGFVDVRVEPQPRLLFQRTLYCSARRQV